MSVLLGGEGAVYRGFDGVREYFRERDDLFPEWHHEVSAIRDLGERVVVIGRVRVRGKGSQAETESAFGYLIELQDGKAIRVGSYLDPEEALEAAGLRQ